MRLWHVNNGFVGVFMGVYLADQAARQDISFTRRKHRLVGHE